MIEGAAVPVAADAPARNGAGTSVLGQQISGPRGPDALLVGAVLALCLIGVVMTFSAGAMFAAKRYGDWTYFLRREVIYAAVGLVAFTVSMRIDYSLYRRFTYPLLFIGIGLLVAVLLVGSRVGGAVRWFRLGPLSFQPSEVAKLALVVYLAALLARKADKVKDFSGGFVPPLIVSGVIIVLLLKQPDLGTAVIIGVTALTMLFVAGTRTSYIILALLIAAPIGWRFIVGTPWRMRRMLAFLDPWAHRRDAGYQTVESLISIGSGGLWGQGLGFGKQKLFFLPEAHTDFILAVIGEELGLLGMLLVLGLFVVLVWRGLRAAARARDVFGTYLAFGLTILLGLQALINMAVVMGLMPTKGLTLPFVSYGGSSLVVSLFGVGILANISSRAEAGAGIPFARGFRPTWVWGRANRKNGHGVRIVVDTGVARQPAVSGAAVLNSSAMLDMSSADSTGP